MKRARIIARTARIETVSISAWIVGPNGERFVRAVKVDPDKLRGSIARWLHGACRIRFSRGASGAKRARHAARPNGRPKGR